MRFVALTRAPGDPQAAARAIAEAAGCTLAEARMRLAPEPPALLARLEDARADALVAALRAAGLPALAIEAEVPTDEDRTRVHRVLLGPGGVRLEPRAGEALDLAWPQVLAIFPGLRVARSVVETTEKSRTFSPGRALLSGGLALSRTSSRTVRSESEEGEQVILVYARDGRQALLSEHALDFGALGARMQPSATANMQELARLLREAARGARYDDRLLRLGRRPLPFLTGGEFRSQGAKTTVTRVDTGGSLDVLAEVMRQAVALGMLP